MFNFDNVGEKMKWAAKIAAWIECAFACFMGFSFLILFVLEGDGVRGILWGLGTAFLGCLFGWLSNLFLYGFGELVTNSRVIRDQIHPEPIPEPVNEPSKISIMKNTSAVGKCEFCQKDNIPIFGIIIEDSTGKMKYRNGCEDCYHQLQK